MPRGRGTGSAGNSRSRRWEPTSYEVGSKSDLAYAQEAHRRAKRSARRQWLITVLILAGIALAVRTWGPDVLRAARVQTHMTTQEFKQAGDHIRSGAERRSGAGLEEQGR